jgi:two-component system sensor histidine kinase EvgS
MIASKKLIFFVFLIFFSFDVSVNYAKTNEINKPDFLTPHEKQWLKEHPKIVLAAETNFPPFEFLNEHQKYRGFSVDYIRTIESLLGIKFEIKFWDNWDKIMEEGKKRKNDIWPTATPTPFRLKFMNFTKPYIKLDAVILTRKNIDKSMQNLESLTDMKVSVISGFGTHEYLKENYPDINLDVVPNTAEGLKKVSFGLVDAMVVNIAMATYFMEKEGITNLEIGGKTGYTYEWGLASRNDWPELNSILEKTLNQIDPLKKKEIYRKWVGLKVKEGLTLKQFLSILFGTLTVFGVGTILVWNRSLKKQVETRTVELNTANAAKSIFLANMSHEIRTPMNAILGYAQILEREPQLEKKYKEYTRNILSSGNHLLNLINEILDLSKIEAGRMELTPTSFDLNAIAKDMSAMFELRCEEKKLRWKNEAVNDKPVWVYGDETKIRQALINLLGNGVKFTDTGEIIFKLTIQEDEHYLFEAIDSGMGIPEEAQKSIFEPFKQDTEGRNKGGTGLGLAISKKQIDLMGGELKVDSELGKGSRFYFLIKLPATLTRPNSKETEKYKQVTQILTERPINILIVDDVKENRYVLKQFLENLGFTILQAENGLEAIDLARKHSFDVIFMDIQMPVMNGIEATLAFREDLRLRDIKIIGLSASVYDYSPDKIKEMQFDDFLLKPFQIEEIIASIDKLISIKWIYQEAEVEKIEIESTLTDYSKITIPLDLHSRLDKFAKEFNLTDFAAALEELSQSDETGRKLAKRLEKHLKTYDFIKIQSILEEIKTIPTHNS